MRIVLVILVAVLGLSIVAIDWFIAQRNPGRTSQLVQWGGGVWAVLSIGILMLLFANHLTFPLNLDLMEGTILQHLERAVGGEPIYPAPYPVYVPLAYNVGYYLISTPFAWFLGLNLVTMRLVAILASIGIGVLLYLIVREKTASRWWGLITVGMFAAAYNVMENYLDNAHSDSWFLFTAILGSYIIDRKRGLLWNLVGVLILVSSFWFKQHGALFVIGGVLYLTWQEGIFHSIPYWLGAAIFGPVLYLFGGPLLFGSHFLYFTFEVPRAWSSLTFYTFRRFGGFIIKNYFVLATISSLYFLECVLRFVREQDRSRLNIWHFQFVFAIATGVLGSLDAGSADNVYIPMGAFFILLGVLGLHEFTEQIWQINRYQLHVVAIVLIFAFFAYNPLTLLVVPEASAKFEQLVNLLENLDGPVYAPSLGQLQGDYKLFPSAHWVALEDMVRGPGRSVDNHPNTRLLLAPMLDPEGGVAYVLSNYPLQSHPLLRFLLDSYVLQTDLGEEFASLSVLPKRFNHGYPRYLYRYDPDS